MKQYSSIKARHPDAILLFRVGDFYETFGEDAIKAAGILGITLTRRANGAASFVELAGFPHHAIDNYLPRLVRAGQRVAICEQLEDPKLAKKIVKRGITELVTPGVSLNDNVLEHKKNNFLACVHIEKSSAGVAFLDLSTGEFMVSQGSIEYADKLLSGFEPREVLYEKGKKESFEKAFGSRYYTYKLDEWAFHNDTAYEKLTSHFRTPTLKGFGVEALTLGITAAGAVMHYLELTRHDRLGHVTSLSRIDGDRYVWLDKFTVRNLELYYSYNEGAKTLISVIDRTLSPMGGRMLKRWISMPLMDAGEINRRLDAVEFLAGDTGTSDQLADAIKQTGDLERLASKISVGRINPREMVQLKNALDCTARIKEICGETGCPPLADIAASIDECKELKKNIAATIKEDAPNAVQKGNVIASGVSAELDELRNILHSGKDYLINMQQREIERTGITSLKIGYNNVFGYYIEVRNTHRDKVPGEWNRKQTLVSGERYITAELKEYEEKILGAEEKILALETELFNRIVEDAAAHIAAMQQTASSVARTDCLLAFARLAEENNYCKPEVNDGTAIDIRQGRHPVIEQSLPPGEEYIANDLFLDDKEQQIIIVTGPNMSGKSALLRQTALIVLLAQTGSFVPAQSASIGIVDKIFTRVGASDNISLGESTFMVEMNEAASILNNLSSRSLILLDEIGRGTSTYDGISIAWAMAEFIHEYPHGKAKTLFATHYHELNEMEHSFSRIKNYNVSIKEMENRVIFLRKLVRGGTEHSFGIHVARMAGMPKSVVKRAGDILAELEKSHNRHSLAKPVASLAGQREGLQLSIFQMDDPVLKQIRDEIMNLDINNLTPVEALNKLNEIKKITGIKDKDN
ncbi:MAG: DNA mismatch repair protein MutS [Marinilabiliales bacterium]|nr:MAG: DNA mismatch repair protein MutS [Marinilabiliales bacterium]